MATRHVFKKRFYRCALDGTSIEAFRWDYEGSPACPACGGQTEEIGYHAGQAPSVISDEIDIEVRHGLCNPDGSPRRYTSMTELRREAAERGLAILGETPKPTQKLLDARAAEAARAGRKQW